MSKKSSTKKKSTTPIWEKPMPDDQFEFLKAVLEAPSPIGLEAAMSYGVIKPAIEAVMPENWETHQFKGNAGLVFDTAPDEIDRTSVMIIGHADKIRMQVRSIGEDGKIWINTDSFLPNVIIGHEVKLFVQDPEKPGSYRIIKGGTIEAMGAIHFSEPEQRTGAKGIKQEQIYLELQLSGEDRKLQVLDLGIRAGDPILLDRPVKRGFGKNAFYGPYLDNGLGCFVVAELAKRFAKKPLKNLRILFTIATHEEIGRFGSAAIAGELLPDVLIGTDVNHDYEAAPNIGSKRMAPIAMGKGFTLSNGSIVSEYLNSLIVKACQKQGIPIQHDVTGRDTGTDAMAAALAGFDSAATSIGFPIRNMHTISESGSTVDLIAAIEGIETSLRAMDEMNDGEGLQIEDLENGHPRLDEVEELTL